MQTEVGRLTGQSQLFFYDAVAPTIDASTIDRDKAFKASRYDKGDAAYLNCPFSKAEYEAFYEALCSPLNSPRWHEHEAKVPYFEGCLPIEVLAARGPKTLSFGPMKPVGLTDPRTGHRPVGLPSASAGEPGSVRCYSMVGFQTRMKWSDQKRVFRMIPGLENAEFVRYGVIHRNTYIQSPQVLNETLQMKAYPNVFFAGQITGVEGYVESAAIGHSRRPQRRPTPAWTAAADTARHDHARRIGKLCRPLRRQGLPADERQLGHRPAVAGAHSGQERKERAAGRAWPVAAGCRFTSGLEPYARCLPRPFS